MKDSDLWLEFNVNINEMGMDIPFCGLCGGNGKIESVTKTPRGSLIKQNFFCICPNGRALKSGRKRGSSDSIWIN